jgi:hypothetical protein
MLAVLAPPVARGDEDVNWQRLRSMPREQRLILSENLKRYDALDTQRKAAIRELDDQLARHPPENQVNEYSVLRRYHLWVQSLPREQKDLLNSTPPEQRMPLVRKLLAEERSTPNLPTPLFLQVAELNAPSPYDVAHRLKLWFELSPAERAETERLPQEKRRPHLEELARKKKVATLHRLTKAEEEKVLDRLQAHPLLKERFSSKLADLKKVIETTKKTDEAKKAEGARRKVAENYYFVEHPPEQVASENLMRFDAALPSWIRAPLDHLPPEEARRRLTILYRLVFPAGREMPADIKPAATTASPATPPVPPAEDKARAPTQRPKPASSPDPF